MGAARRFPFTKAATSAPGLLRKILRDIELTPEELRDWM